MLVSSGGRGITGFTKLAGHMPKHAYPRVSLTGGSGPDKALFVLVCDTNTIELPLQAVSAISNSPL